MAPSRPLLSDRLALVLCALAGLCCAGAVFGSHLGELRTHFLGEEYVDHYGTQWFYWYTERQLRALRWPDHTDLFFHPYGKDIFGHTGSNVLDGVVAIPFRVLLGPVLGYNLFLLVGLLAGGAAAYALCRDHVEDRAACLVAALLLGLSPFVLHEVAEGRPTQALLLPLILFLRSLLRLGRGASGTEPLKAGFWLAVTGYQYWYYALFAGMTALAHGLLAAAVARADDGGPWPVLRRHAVAAGLALLLVGPVALPMVLAAREVGAVAGLLDTRAWNLSYTPPVTMEGITVGLFAWQPFLRLAGFHILTGDNEEVFLAQSLILPWFWAPLLLGWIVLARRGGRSALPMAGMALVSMVLATGSVVLVGGLALPNPPFIGLMHLLDVMRRLWWPARALAILVVLMAPMTALILDRLRGRRPLLGLGLGLALLGANLGELRAAGRAPMDAWDAGIPAGYRCLADGPDGALIELPYVWTQAHLYYQTAHGRPILGGMLEDNEVFTPAEITRLREENGFLLALRNAAATGETEGDSAEAREELRFLGYRYVVVQKDAYQSANLSTSRADTVIRTRQRRLNRGLRELLGEPVYDDARLAIYAPWGDPRPCAETAVAPDTSPAERLQRARLDPGRLPARSIDMRRPGLRRGEVPGRDR